MAEGDRYGSFKDGVWLVTLAPVADPLLIRRRLPRYSAYASELINHLIDGLVAYLENRQPLLVLDNCEHLLDACAELAGELLQACSTLPLLVTSREPLRISGELAWRVPSLAIPATRVSQSPDEPLAIELATAWVRAPRGVSSGADAFTDCLAATRPVEEGIALQRHTDGRFVLAFSLDALGQLATAEGHFAEARTALRESLGLRMHIGDPVGSAETMESIAALATAENEFERAVQLAGAAAGIRQSIGATLHPMHSAVREGWLVPLRKRLGEAATTLAWEAGRTTPVDKAVELVLAEADAPPIQPKRAAEPSPRGQEVAAVCQSSVASGRLRTSGWFVRS